MAFGQLLQVPIRIAVAGPRLTFLIISPYAKVNYVDHSVIDQTSIVRFIEANWGLKRIGDQSFDAKAGSVMNMFDFTTNHYAKRLFLDTFKGSDGQNDDNRREFSLSYYYDNNLKREPTNYS
jgi:hypothetical protein